MKLLKGTTMIRRILLLVAAMLLTACAPTLKIEQYGKGLREIREDELPRQVAILPFANETGEPGLDAVVRRNFANHFSAKAFHDLKLPVVDEKLVRFEKGEGKTARESTPGELSAALGSDGLLYGKVTDYLKLYAGVYSQLGLEAEVWLVNGQTGQEIFRIRESVRYHEGGVPTSPLAAVVTAVSAAMNLREIQKVRLVNELCYRFMEKIPSPSTLASAEKRPVIREVLSNAAEGPFGPKRLIKVGLQGDPGLVATFDLGNFKTGLPMKEITPGIYAGEYAVLPGDAIRDTPVTVTLTRPGGLESQWIDVSGFVSIDTTPPPPVTGLRAKGFFDRVELTWEQVKNTPDLKGYRVLRSETPLSGYRELALIEVGAYSDSSAQGGRVYFYRVLPVDQAGNEADPNDGVRGTLAASEPVKLAGVLKADTVLDGIYLVTGPVVVPKGINLTITGESRLTFAAGTGLQVRGRLTVQGGETPVEFLPDGAGEWSGISLEGARAELRRFAIKGASVGIESSGSEALLEAGNVSGAKTGVAVAGMAPVELKGLTISGNGTGLRLSGTAAKVSGCSIVQNTDGILADGFSGEIRDSNILDNGRNIHADRSLTVGPNWFGTTRADGLKLSNVIADTVYNGWVPGGQTVAPLVNPYARLTVEERQRKGAELLVEAGGYFRQRNFGKAATLFGDSLLVFPAAETYYYLGLCHQEMKEPDQALKLLMEGTVKFPQEPLLWKSLGMLAYEKGDGPMAKRALEEALRLSPDDRQSRFVLERLRQ